MTSFLIHMKLCIVIASKRQTPSLSSLIRLWLNPREPLPCLSLTMPCLSFRRTIITCVLADKGFLLGSRYNHLVSLAATHHKTIRMNYLHISRLEHAVENIASYSRTLATSVDELWTGMDNVYHMGVVLQALHSLESAVNSVLHTNALVIQNVVDADIGRVTSSLFPVRDLHRALDIGVEDHQQTPLFDLHAITHYYPLLE